MSEPIKIVVTADTAQAAAAMTQFVTQAGSGLRVLSAGGTVADGSLKQLRESALGLREGFHALETGVYLLGGQRFPALAESVMGVRSTMMLARTAALLTGASLGVVSATIAALGAALLPTAIFGWRAYTAAQDEARSKSDLLNQSLMLQSRLTEQINNLNKAGYLDDADMLLIQNARDQAEMANPDDPNAGNKAQQKYLMDRGFTKPAIEAMNELIKLQHQLHEESLTGFDGERQKAKEELDQRLADIKAYAKEAGPLLYSRDAQGSDATVAGNNFSKKIAGIDTAEQTQKAREAIEALKDQQAETTGDALAGKQKREGFTEEEFGNWTAAIHDLQKKYTLAEDVLTEANKYGVAQRVAGIKSETAEQKKLNDEKKQAAQLQAEIARAEIEAKLKGIEGNPLLTKQEKDQKSLPLYKQEMSDDEGLKADQLAIQNDPAKTDLEKSDAKKEYNKLLDQQAELENKIKAIEGE
ncbi:MAG TPA: hypothetical protein VHY30_01595, partial [Verrucomicrobiae bacterium]|nr:hypothetical protein [Verrucomicrobiae bacterium]